MGYNRPTTYALSTTFEAFNPVDSTLYYFGRIGAAPTTASSLRRIFTPRAGTIRAVILNTYASTAAGTNEPWVILIRVNDTTDYAFATVTSNDATRTFENYSLNIPVTQGGYVVFKSTTPAWVTNPEGVSGWGSLLVESP